MGRSRNPKQIPMPPPGKLMLSVLEAAAVMGLGRSTVYDLVKDRVLPHRRIGRRILLRRPDIEHFMQPDQNV